MRHNPDIDQDTGVVARWLSLGTGIPVLLEIPGTAPDIGEAK